MEAVLLWAAALCFGVAFLIVVVALITKPRRMRKKAQKAETRAKEVADIYGRVAVTRVKLGGLERATRILEEARKGRSVTK